MYACVLTKNQQTRDKLVIVGQASGGGGGFAVVVSLESLVYANTDTNRLAAAHSPVKKWKWHGPMNSFQTNVVFLSVAQQRNKTKKKMQGSNRRLEKRSPGPIACLQLDSTVFDCQSLEGLKAELKALREVRRQRKSKSNISAHVPPKWKQIGQTESKRITKRQKDTKRTNYKRIQTYCQSLAL